MIWLNENNAHAAQWLRNLIKAGHLPDFAPHQQLLEFFFAKREGRVVRSGLDDLSRGPRGRPQGKF